MDLTRLPVWARITAVGCAGSVTAGAGLVHIVAGLIVGGILGFGLLVSAVDVGDGE